MARSPQPVVLELASLPREQVGPFLLLGLDKTAHKSEVDAHWAERLKWARKQTFRVPLEDINWARNLLVDADTERWVRADAASLNADTRVGVVAAVRRGLGAPGPGGRHWQALDSEKPLADYIPEAEVPDPQAVRAALAAPQVPAELPAVAPLLEQLVRQPMDPWGLDLPHSE
jgi:hypothetical protein